MYQVLPIWEGTSSVMSLDVVRAISKTRGEALVALSSKVASVVETSRTVPGLEDVSEKVARAVKDVVTSVRDNPESIEAMARDLCVSIAHTYIATLLIGKTFPVVKVTLDTKLSVHSPVCLKR